MADTDLPPPLPDYVDDGTYEDEAWRAAVSKKTPLRNKAEKRLAENQPQPRRHPFGPDAVLAEVEPNEQYPEGLRRWYPNQAARDAAVQLPQAKRPPARSAAEGDRKQPEVTRKAQDEVAERGQAEPKPAA